MASIGLEGRSVAGAEGGEAALEEDADRVGVVEQNEVAKERGVDKNLAAMTPGDGDSEVTRSRDVKRRLVLPLVQARVAAWELLVFKRNLRQTRSNDRIHNCGSQTGRLA
jgi:hypothetical protein